MLQRGGVGTLRGMPGNALKSSIGLNGGGLSGLLYRKWQFLAKHRKVRKYVHLASGNFSLISKSGQSDSKIETLSDVNDVYNYSMYCSAENSSSYPPLPRCHKSHICRIS